MPWIAPIFFISGIAGLIYEVTWVRQFGNLFGNTVHSASFVAASFMLGLGLGSYGIGIWSDRLAATPRKLLRAYAFAEIGIALLALLVIFFFAHAEGLSAGISSYRIGENGWHVLTWSSHAIRYVLATLLLAPITFLMGGTLPLLFRYVVGQDIGSSGSRMGFLYGVNTAGAALGAFLIDALLIPNLGVSSSQSIAVMLNLIAGVGVLHLSRADAAQGPAKDPVRQKTADSPEWSSTSRRVVPLVGAAIFIAGFAAMGTQVLWFRYLSSALASTRSVFSVLLTIILVGIWLGSWAGGAAQKRFGNPAFLFLITQALFISTTLITLLIFDRSMQESRWLEELYRQSHSLPAKTLVEYFHLARFVAWVCGVPAFFTGFSYPLANACTQRALHAAGRRAGALYLANTAGAVLGSLVAGFILVPWLGTQSSLTVLAFVATAGLVPLVVSDGRIARFGLGSASLGLVLVGALACWVLLPQDWLLKRLHASFEDGNKRFSLLRDGLTESIGVLEDSRSGDRMLFTNGYQMSGTDFLEQRYMHSFVHFPLLQLEHPTDVLVICFGVGNTAYTASLYDSVRRIEVVDLSRDILGEADRFSRWNRGVLKDPRVSVFVNDGRQHLRMQEPSRYDLVTLEPPPLNRAGVASLYSQEFFSLVAEHLKTGGFLTEWLPIGQQSVGALKSVIKAFVEVFPNTIMVSGYRGHFILIGRKGLPIQLDPAQVRAKLQASPRLLADLREIKMGSLTDLAGSFVNSSEGLRAITEGVVPMSDDYPALEYSMVVFNDPIFLPGLVDITRIKSWCPQCGSAGAEGSADVADYLVAIAPIYGSLNSAGSAAREVPERRLRELVARYPIFSDFIRLPGK